jgi:hypothetical protein
MRFRNSIEIKEPSDFELIADDILTDYIDSFHDIEGLTKLPTQDDIEEFGEDNVPVFMFSDKGINLYNRAVDRLIKLGEKIFPDEELDIKSSNIIEP